MDTHEVWKTALGEIETEVSGAHFFTFFKKASLLSLDDNIAIIAVQSSIGIDLLQKRFSGVIKSALKKNTGKEYKLSFVAKTIQPKNKEEKTGPLFSQVPDNISTSTFPSGFMQKPLPKQLSRVRPEFRFETLAVSTSNQLAFVSAQTVAKNLGKSYNPLFMYGPVGVGKTHLMQAIANDVYEKSPEKIIIYMSSEEFTNEVVEAIRNNDTSRMKKKFRAASLLIIDDIQFFAGKEKVQEELFHTFNILIDRGAQIVLSSDRPPQEIKKLEKRLSSRFASGLTVDIEAPDFELRTAILLIKAKKYGVELPIDVAKTIAEKAVDARSLEGMLLRIVTEAKTKKQDVTSDMVSKIFKKNGEEENIRLHPDDIVNKICRYYNIKTTQIKGPKRDAYLVKARQIAMYLLKKELGMTFVEIGNLLGGRDHTTIMHGIEKLEDITENNTHHTTSVEIMGIKKILIG